MAGKLILLTGGTGHVGYATLIETLSKGYYVRAAVRSEAKAAVIKAAKSTQPYLDKLSFVIVPDIEKAGAFNEAVKGVDYIMHIASPLSRPTDDDEANIIQPAIRGTVGILYSALKEPSIKRVVITSSVAAVSPSEPKVYTADDIQPDPKGPYPNSFVAYAASKKLAYSHTRAFIAKEKPQFTIINIMPTFVIGKNELATTLDEIKSGSNRLAFPPLLGGSNSAGMPGASCHIDDVAYVHVAALDPKIEGNQNFGVNWDVNGVQWDDGIEIVKKHFPREVEKGIFPLGGSQTSLPMPFDARKTEEVFGIKFKNFEEQIVNLASYYAEVAQQA